MESALGKDLSLFMSSISEQKRELWTEKTKEINHTVDFWGLGIDDQIKDTVVVLNLLGLNTTASCEGHLDKGLLTPWVDVAYPNEPKIQYIGQKEIFQQFAEIFNMPLPEFERGFGGLGYRLALFIASTKGETEEYKEWACLSDTLGETIEKYLKEFYENNEVNDFVRINTTLYFGRWWIWCGENILEPMFEVNLYSQEYAQYLLSKRQAEMKAFTEFLKRKYFLE